MSDIHKITEVIVSTRTTEPLTGIIQVTTAEAEIKFEITEDLAHKICPDLDRFLTQVIAAVIVQITARSPRCNKTIQYQRKTARTLSQSDPFSRSPSCLDGDGCAALIGSDAGKLSIKPASSLAWVSRSAKAALRGLAACLS
jgi:hypothetical protein